MKGWVAVVDDDNANLIAADRILTAHDYQVTSLRSGEELIAFLKTESPDLILLDVHLTGMDGFETIRVLHSQDPPVEIPIVVLTADTDADTETNALSAGAMDFVAKPFIPSVLLMRVQHTIELSRLQRDLKKEVRIKTEEALKEHTRYERLSLQIVKTLAETIDAKDSYTRGHSARVADYAKMIAQRAGYSETAQNEIYIMGLLHDVGKIGIPDTIINKPCHLTDDEYAIIRSHPMKGFEILRNISELPKLAIGARWHHERYDGKGYPDGLIGKDIPEEARIIAVADAYDAMSSRRSYHDVLTQYYILGELETGKGLQFDPAFADIMIELIREDKDFRMREIVESSVSRRSFAMNPEPKTEPRQAVSVLLEACGFHTESGLRYCMGDPSFYQEMLLEFANGSADRIIQMELHFADDNWEQFRVHVHALKSASRMIGADTLSQQSRALEDAARDCDADFIRVHFPALLAQLRQDVASIHTVMDAVK